MFLGLVRKTCSTAKYPGPLALSYESTRELVISPVSTIPKKMSFRSQLFNSSFVAPVNHTFFIAPCIDALVHLYSLSHFGY
jgi:hypothetical protein